MCDSGRNLISCLDCKHHMFSDCYLECEIHMRINNKEICKDFEMKNTSNYVYCYNKEREGKTIATPQNCYVSEEWSGWGEVLRTIKGVCSCGQLVDSERHNFCPRCGIKLNWEGEEDDN